MLIEPKSTKVTGSCEKKSSDYKDDDKDDENCVEKKAHAISDAAKDALEA